MNERHLHVISFDVPYPANYGGVIDVFYRIKALSDLGIMVHLHCYEYGRGRQVALERMCHEVLYYKRDTSFLRQLSLKPYIVTSRNAEELVRTLLKDDYPILCEGLHTTAILSDKRLIHRRMFVRAHNVEHDYYKALGRAEPKLWKKIFYLVEAWKMSRYEPVLHRADGIFAISQHDVDYFSKRFAPVVLLPGFNSLDKVCSLSGRGDYLLYHGNLSVLENINAAKWLINNVFSIVNYPCVIAGLNPPEKLKKWIEPYPNVTLVANPDDAEMIGLLRHAQVNVLVTHQPTGLKLKLLNALYNGRFCLANSDMVKGSALDGLCVIADGTEQMIAAIDRLMKKDFTPEDVEERDAMMRSLYHNEANAQLLVSLMFEGSPLSPKPL